MWSFFGSSSHSNDELLTRSSLIFFEISVVNTIMAVDNRIFTTAVVTIIIITFLVFHKFLNWKSSILFLY